MLLTAYTENITVFGPAQPLLTSKGSSTLQVLLVATWPHSFQSLLKRKLLRINTQAPHGLRRGLFRWILREYRRPLNLLMEQKLSSSARMKDSEPEENKSPVDLHCKSPRSYIKCFWVSSVILDKIWLFARSRRLKAKFSIAATKSKSLRQESSTVASISYSPVQTQPVLKFNLILVSQRCLNRGILWMSWFYYIHSPIHPQLSIFLTPTDNFPFRSTTGAEGATETLWSLAAQQWLTACFWQPGFSGTEHPVSTE